MVRVVFLHPDLGIGGAERLVVDAAMALQSKGHQVHIVTSHHDPSHCFPETADGRIRVTVSGSWIPRSLFGRCLALCAYLRMIWAALFVVLSGCEELKADVYFCDQVSMCIPVLKVFRRAPILFYCHYPDLLLSSHKSWLQRIYRAPLDWFEEKTTGMATAIVVNSHFTGSVFRDTFQSLSIRPQVLYPSLNFEAFDRPFSPDEDEAQLEDIIGPAKKGHFVYLSINRYERKKNLPLAIQAFARLRTIVGNSVHLIMAGGYDPRLPDNVEVHRELQELAKALELPEGSVTFLRSPTDSVKALLLRRADVLIYTPDREHFGIVPLEVMYCERPVVAVASGGPLESIEDGRTGFLCQQTAEDFADKMAFFHDNPSRAVEMGKRGRQRVIEHFSFDAFGRQLDSLVTSLVAGPKKND